MDPYVYFSLPFSCLYVRRVKQHRQTKVSGWRETLLADLSNRASHESVQSLPHSTSPTPSQC